MTLRGPTVISSRPTATPIQATTASTGISVGLDVSDSTGTPTEFLPRTRAEMLYNDAHHTLERRAVLRTSCNRRPVGVLFTVIAMRSTS